MDVAVVNLTVNTAKDSSARSLSGSGNVGGTPAGNSSGCGDP